jgi:hypothetical protein
MQHLRHELSIMIIIRKLEFLAIEHIHKNP